MQGAHSAAVASGGEMPPWTNAVPIPPGYFEHWTPGVGEEAANIAGPGLAEVLRERDGWAKEITDTELDRIAEALTKCVEGGQPISAAKDAIDAVIHDEQRAWLIADTEYARASTVARRDTYRANNVPYVRWIHQPGACPRCMENASVSPIPLTASWPEGDVPVHPKCRCVEAPYYPSRGTR